MRALRIGVVGTGFAASSHVEALRRVPGATLAGVAASSPEKGEQAAAALAAERAFRDWRELIADPSVEVVHNCTPNDLHYEVNAATLEAGKHLLSEKPLALNASETAALAERAASAGVVAGVCFNYRHYPLVRELKELLAESDGSPHLVRGAYLQDWLLEETDWNWRVEPARAGASRAVGDIGSHWLDLAEHVTGDRVIAVCAELGRIHAERLRPSGATETFVRTGSDDAERVAVETEDFATALLRFASGCRGVLTVSQVTAGRKNRLLLEVDTARESFAWDP